jgi:hypothetical protein
MLVRGNRIADEIAEAVLAHARPGIRGVYDRHNYLDERFEAMQLWADRITEITGSRPNPKRLKSKSFLCDKI